MFDSGDLQYIAGFFDGEGSITLGRHYSGSRHTPGRQLSVRITNTHKEVLEWIKSLFGGSIVTKEAGDGRRTNHNWQVQCQLGRSFLIVISPYLHLKNEQAKVAINYQNRTSRNNKRLSPEQRKTNEESAEIIRRLNNGERISTQDRRH